MNLKKAFKGIFCPLLSINYAAVTLTVLSGWLAVACENIYPQSEPLPKKIKQIVRKYDEYKKTEFSFYYTKSGRLSRATAYSFNQDIASDKYFLDIVYDGYRVRMTGLFQGRQCQLVYVLSSGLAQTCVFTDYDEEVELYYKFLYTDDGCLAEISQSLDPDYVLIKESLKFAYAEGGLLTAVKHTTNVRSNREYTLAYTGKTNRVSVAFPLFWDLFNEAFWNYEIAFYADILGQTNGHLATSCVEINYTDFQQNKSNHSYSFDGDGYVQNATMSAGNMLTFIFE